MKVAMQWVALAIIVGVLFFLAVALDRIVPRYERRSWLCIECRKYSKDAYYVTTGEKTVYVCPACFEKNESK